MNNIEAASTQGLVETHRKVCEFIDNCFLNTYEKELASAAKKHLSEIESEVFQRVKTLHTIQKAIDEARKP